MTTVLERLIDEKGFRKGFIAHVAGLHPSRLSRLLHSERDPKLDADAAAAIAERLGVPAEAFFDGERLLMANGVGVEHENTPTAAPEQRETAPPSSSGPYGHHPSTGQPAASQEVA